MTPRAPANLALPQPYLLFLGDITDAEYAKTAFGLRDWATEPKRSGKLLLTVGADCRVRKKDTALALTRAFLARGIAPHFRATGQTGIMIAGGGIPIDAVVADFAAGAAEILSPDAADDH